MAFVSSRTVSFDRSRILVLGVRCIVGKSDCRVQGREIRGVRVRMISVRISVRLGLLLFLNVFPALIRRRMVRMSRSGARLCVGIAMGPHGTT